MLLLLLGLLGVGLYVMFWQMYLENLEELLQLHHQRPISLDQVVAEVILAGIDALAGNLRKREREQIALH